MILIGVLLNVGLKGLLKLRFLEIALNEVVQHD